MADFETYCAAPDGDAAVHICGVYEIADGVVTGVDTFFLLFAVSRNSRPLLHAIQSFEMLLSMLFVLLLATVAWNAKGRHTCQRCQELSEFSRPDTEARDEPIKRHSGAPAQYISFIICACGVLPWKGTAANCVGLTVAKETRSHPTFYAAKDFTWLCFLLIRTWPKKCTFSSK